MLETYKERFYDEAHEIPPKPTCGDCDAFSASLRFDGLGCCCNSYEVVAADDEACDWLLEEWGVQ